MVLSKKSSDLERIFKYAWDFYKSRLIYIIALSVPLFISWFILIIIQAPTYPTLGAPHIRTGSFPDLSFLDVFIVIVGYLVAMLIVAETVVNINLLIKSKRMQTSPSSEVWKGLENYALPVFYYFIILFLIVIIAQLLTFERPLQSIIYPLIIFLISFYTFFTAPAIVIDEEDTFSALKRAYKLAKHKPKLIFAWTVFGLIVLTLLGWIFLDLNIIPKPFSTFLFVAINILFVSPFLLILQTQMYVEKYPLAK